MTEKRPQNCGTGYCSCIECPYEAEQAEQEPVGEMIDKAGYKGAAWYLGPPATGTKLYTAPVRTKDLTDDEIYTLYSEPCSDREMVEFARAVIAADREKNK